MRTIRTVLFIAWLILTTLVLGIIALPLFILPRRVLWPLVDLWVALVLGAFYFLIGVSVEIKGRENIPKGPLLIASKHQAMWDTIIVFRLFDRPSVVFKRELLFVPIYGWAAMRLGMIGIDRTAHASALRRMLNAARKRLAEGRSIIIFPEGTRVNPGETLEYRPGVAALYRQLGLRCLPVALNSGLCWPGRGWDFRPGKITLEILPPIDAGLPRKEFMALLEERIETASIRLAALKHSP